MSDNTTELIRTETDSLTVKKHFEPRDEEIVHVIFTIDVEGDEPAGVKIVEDIPEEVPGDRVGFPPEYDDDHWTIKGRSLVYEASVPADEEHVTLYGAEASIVDQLRQEPSIERVPQQVLPKATDESVPETHDYPDNDVSGPFDWGEGEADFTRGGGTETGVDSTETASDEASDKADDFTRGGGTDTEVDSAENASDEASDEAADFTRGGGTDTGADSAETASDEADGAPSGTAIPTKEDVSTSPDELLSALVTALDETDLSEEEQVTFREALDLGAPANENTLEARLRHVQNTVDDLEAYRDALGDLIADHGTGETIVDGFERDIASLEASVADLSESLSDIETQLEELASDDDLATVSERIDTLDSDLEGLSERVEGTEDSIDELDSDLAAVNEAITTGQEWRRQVSQATTVPPTDESAESADETVDQEGEETVTDGGDSNETPPQ